MRSLSRAMLTNRRRQVLDLLLAGKVNKEIAQALNISVRTVKFHVSSLLAIYGARSRYQLMAMHIGRGNHDPIR